MPRTFMLALLFVAALGCDADSNPAPVNLDFESGSPGEVPPGWLSPTAKVGYTVALSTDAPKQGKQSVRLSRGAAIDPAGPGFGNIMQQIDATPYRGKRVRFRGAVRVDGAAATAALWMRVDRAAKQIGFFDNMQDRPIRGETWAYYEITGDIAGDAEVLNVGMTLQQEGSAWLDDVTIQTVAPLKMRAGPPRAVTPRGLDNLLAFTRLFGIVRHFHASDEAAAADWDAVAVNGADAVESARNPSELASRLREVFVPLAPSVRIELANAPPPASATKPPGARDIVAWRHKGLGPKEAQAYNIYSRERVRHNIADADPKLPDPLQPLQLDLGGGVSASIPLAVYADASHTLPRPPPKAPSYPTDAYTGNDRATRIGAVVIIWNALQHFYPYFDVVDADWPAELKTALRAAGTDAGEAAFLGTLKRLIAALDDGHGSIQHASMQGRVWLPLRWRAAGDTIIVGTVDEGVTELKPGDELVAIDGRPALQAVRESEALISGTPQWRRTIALSQLGTGVAGTQSTLTIRNDTDDGTGTGTTRNVTLTRNARPERLREKRPEKIAELKPGLWYVDLERVSDADIEAAMEKLAAARGIVFDMRGYPRIGPKLLQHMTGTVIESARWNVPILSRPDFQGVEWATDGRWSLEPLQPRLTRNIVFLTDARAISYAESWMGIVEAYKLAEIVGETTARANGNVNTVPLPGGYRIAFTGMKVLKHDSSHHHGVGIVPTVPVARTIEGIRAGRDEQLEKAVEVLENSPLRSQLAVGGRQ